MDRRRSRRRPRPTKKEAEEELAEDEAIAENSDV